MKVCFAFPMNEYMPKGDVLQFLTLLKAIDRKVNKLPAEQRNEHIIDCVFSYPFVNGQDGFMFNHVNFYHTNHLTEMITQLDRKRDYDFIFVRGRKESLDLLKADPDVKTKLLVLSIHYNTQDKQEMNEMLYLLEHVRLLFFQSAPWAHRFKTYAQYNGAAHHHLNQKIQVLPQYVEIFSKEKTSKIKRLRPLQLAQIGVIRTRYVLPMAIRATELIRTKIPQVFLHVAYPAIEANYKETALPLLQSPVVKDYGQLSLWQSKELILTAGIGLALIFDDTVNKNPTYSYQSRVLECLSLGVPVITTKTAANIHLLGKQYPLYIRNEHDILHCYRRLSSPRFYQKMSDTVRKIGKQFIYDIAIEKFWSLLVKEFNSQPEKTH